MRTTKLTRGTDADGRPTCYSCIPPVAFAGASLEDAAAFMDRHDEVNHNPVREDYMARARRATEERERKRGD